MTPAEAQMLLGIAASFDNRKPSEEAAVSWSHALGDYPFVDCRDAVVEHYRSSTDWIMPGHIIAIVRRVRSKRIAGAGDLTPPPGTEAEQRAWLAGARRHIADGGTVDSDAAYGELKPRHLPELRALMSAPPTVHPEPEETK